MSEEVQVTNVVASRASAATSDRVTGTIVALLIALAFFLVGRQIWRVATGPLPPGVGMVAPAFSGPVARGGTLELSRFEGQVVLLDFWATWCPPCVAAMPALQAMDKRYGGQGFAVVGLNQEPYDAPKVKAFLRKHELTFPSVIDLGAIARDYGVVSFPTSFLVGRDGRVRRVWRGPAPERALAAAIEAALAETP